MSRGEPRRVALVTGAGGTLGDAFCRAYADVYDVVAVCRSRAPGVPSQYEEYVDPLAPDAELPENAFRVHRIDADLEEPGALERVVEVTLARFGGVDLLVNAAAYVRLHRPGLTDRDGIAADLDRAFAVNVGIPVALAALLAERCWRDADRTNVARNRNIVNVSSLSATRVYPHQGQAVYAATKAALEHVTRHQATDFGTFGVRVNALAPNAFPRLVDTAEVARGIVRLDRGSGTGKVLRLPGADTPA